MEGERQRRGGECGAEEGKEAEGGEGAGTRALTRGAHGLDGPPPQGPLAQHHIAAVPPNFEDAPEQNLLGSRLWRLRERPRRGGHSGRSRGRLFLPAALQGAHAAAPLPPRHG